MEEKLIIFADGGPTEKEISFKNDNRICTMVHYINGDAEFCCDNYIAPYTYKVFGMMKPIKIFIKDAMICKSCIKKLSDHFKINFSKELPKFYFNQQFPPLVDDIPPLIVQVQNELKNKYDMEKINIDPELQIFFLKHYYIGLTTKWLYNLRLHETILSGSKYQGNRNGPDYIFIDKNKKLVGLEIVSYKWNLFNSFKDLEFSKKYIKDKIYSNRSLDEILIDLEKIIIKKSNHKYSKTNELYLGIVFNTTILDYEYAILEILLNKFIKNKNTIFNGILIL